MLYAGLFLSSCTEKEPEEVLVSSVSLNKSSVEMSVGEIVELTATVLPENAETLDVTWASSDPGIATVEDGLVTAIKAGEAEITVKTIEGGKTDVCKVIVKADPVVFALDKVTAATATFSGHLNVPAADLPYCQVSVYYSDAENFNMNDAKSASVTVFDDNQDFAITLKNLKYGVKYHYCMVADIKQSDKVYGEIKEFTTKAVTLSLAYTGSTATTATISGKVTGLSPEDQEYIKVGLYYSDNLENLTEYFRNKVLAEDIQDDGSFSLILSDLTLGNKYYYCTYIYCSAYSKDSEAAAFGDAHEFIVGEHVSMTAKVDEASITATTAQIIGKIEGISTDEMEGFAYGICYSCEPITDSNRGITRGIEELSEDGSFSLTLSGLAYGTKYYYCSYMKQGYSSRTYGDVQEFTTTDVSIIDTYVDNTSGPLTYATIYIKTSGISEVDLETLDLSIYNSSCITCINRAGGNSSHSGDNFYHMPLTKRKYDEFIKDEGLFKFVKQLNYQSKIYYRTVITNPINWKDLLGEVKTVIAGEFTEIDLSIDENATTITSARILGKIKGYSSEENVKLRIGYSKNENINTFSYVNVDDITADGEFSVNLNELDPNSNYYYTLFINGVPFPETKNFTTQHIPLEVVLSIDKSSITGSSFTINGKVNGYSLEYNVEIGISYSNKSADAAMESGINMPVTDISGDGRFKIELKDLFQATKYYLCPYFKYNNYYHYFDASEFSTKDVYSDSQLADISSAFDLSSTSPANCYIVTEAGFYKFKTVKGNSNTSVGNVTTSSILWESYGTSVKPQPLDLISTVSYNDGYIAFKTSDVFREGNAVITAKDANGNILWSWHIWLTDQPQEQVYYNKAGTMMDRNLGATSATIGDVGALGLLYQWGRKDPFLGSSSIDNAVVAESTMEWPKPTYYNNNYVFQAINSSVSHPTTFLTRYKDYYDWVPHTGDLVDKTRWKEEKTIYDPCPTGWRVPEGGTDGVWSKAYSNTSSYEGDAVNCGTNFWSELGDGSIWYPYAGIRDDYGNLEMVGEHADCWSVTDADYSVSRVGANVFRVNNSSIRIDAGRTRACAVSVRCVKE